jgi:hypothetical protein
VSPLSDFAEQLRLSELRVTRPRRADDNRASPHGRGALVDPTRTKNQAFQSSSLTHPKPRDPPPPPAPIQIVRWPEMPRLQMFPPNKAKISSL